MKKALGHRVAVVGLIAALIISPAWAGIAVTINPAAGSTRPTTENVLGHGDVVVVVDNIDDWYWKFGFGTKTSSGGWAPELEQTIGTVTTSNWAHTLVNQPWNVSAMNGMMPDHFARVTRISIYDSNTRVIQETAQHKVTN